MLRIVLLSLVLCGLKSEARTPCKIPYKFNNPFNIDYYLLDQATIKYIKEYDINFVSKTWVNNEIRYHEDFYYNVFARVDSFKSYTDGLLAQVQYFQYDSLNRFVKRIDKFLSDEWVYDLNTTAVKYDSSGMMVRWDYEQRDNLYPSTSIFSQYIEFDSLIGDMRRFALFNSTDNTIKNESSDSFSPNPDPYFYWIHDKQLTLKGTTADYQFVESKSSDMGHTLNYYWYKNGTKKLVAVNTYNQLWQPLLKQIVLSDFTPARTLAIEENRYDYKNRLVMKEVFGYSCIRPMVTTYVRNQHSGRIEREIILNQAQKLQPDGSYKKINATSEVHYTYR